jgi:hypothetical protein
MTKIDPAPMDFVRGDATGLFIPAHPEALRAAGPDFLTRAFQAFGSLAPGDRVARITRCELCPGGSTGQKLFLAVEYEKPAPGLHTDLFVKFSRDFSDKVRDDRGKYEMEGEVRFAALSRLPGFPITTPVAYFADFHHESKTGVLITEQVAFGAGDIEPQHIKCLDHELSAPIDHYRAIVKSLARVAAVHRSGRLPADIDAWFPFDPGAAAAGNPIPYDEPQLRERVAQFADFAARAPQLFPADVASAELFAKLDREVGRFLEHEAAIKRFQQSDPDFIALCHWNANIDNAWFWRDASGELQCGLMDWGHAGQMNVAFALWGCLCGAGLEIWDEHLDELLTLFLSELHEHGGPRLPIAELKLHLDMYVAIMGLSYFLDCPSRILFRLPEAVQASGPRDPVFCKSETARNQLHIATTVLHLWRTHDFGGSLERLRQRLPRGAAG